MIIHMEEDQTPRQQAQSQAMTAGAFLLPIGSMNCGERHNGGWPLQQTSRALCAIFEGVRDSLGARVFGVAGAHNRAFCGGVLSHEGIPLGGGVETARGHNPLSGRLFALAVNVADEKPCVDVAGHDLLADVHVGLSCVDAHIYAQSCAPIKGELHKNMRCAR